MDFEFVTVEKPIAIIQLVFAMLGMGAALTVEDFLRVLKTPMVIFVVLVAQFILVPLGAYALIQWFQWDAGLAVGLVLMSALPSGTYSNIFTYLGRGNLPLSISATACSTVVCLMVTPLVLQTLTASHVSEEINMPVGSVVQNILLCTLLPLGIGMLVRRYWESISEAFSKWSIRISILFLTLLIIGSLTAGRVDFSYGLPVMITLIVFSAVVLGMGYLLGYLFGYTRDDSFTIAIEIMFRNGNLGMTLNSIIFPASVASSAAIAPGVLFVILFYSGVAQIVSLAAIGTRVLRFRREAAAAKAELALESVEA